MPPERGVSPARELAAARRSRDVAPQGGGRNRRPFAAVRCCAACRCACSNGIPGNAGTRARRWRVEACTGRSIRLAALERRTELAWRGVPSHMHEAERPAVGVPRPAIPRATSGGRPMTIRAGADDEPQTWASCPYAEGTGISLRDCRGHSGGGWSSLRLMLSQIARMIETAGLQIGARHRDFRQCGLRQNLGSDIVDRQSAIS